MAVLQFDDKYTCTKCQTCCGTSVVFNPRSGYWTACKDCFGKGWSEGIIPEKCCQACGNVERNRKNCTACNRTGMRASGQPLFKPPKIATASAATVVKFAGPENKAIVGKCWITEETKVTLVEGEMFVPAYLGTKITMPKSAEIEVKIEANTDLSYDEFKAMAEKVREYERKLKERDEPQPESAPPKRGRLIEFDLEGMDGQHAPTD